MAKKGKVPPVVCPGCGKEFKNMAGLKGHAKSKKCPPGEIPGPRPPIDPMAAESVPEDKPAVQAEPMPEAMPMAAEPMLEPAPSQAFDDRDPMPAELARSASKPVPASYPGIPINPPGPAEPGPDWQKYLPIIGIIIGVIVLVAAIYLMTKKKPAPTVQAHAAQPSPARVPPVGASRYLDADNPQYWGASE